MKKHFLSLISISFFYSSLNISCPTCIGFPKKGCRPFFETRTIQYIKKDQKKELVHKQASLTIRKKYKQ